MKPFMPKPPPTSGVVTRSFCGGRLRTWQTRSRAPPAPCVPVCSVKWSACGSYRPMALRVSIGLANPMETRNAIGLYDPQADHFTLHTGTQGAGGARERVCHVLNLPPQKLRVTTPDVGGGFGMKGFVYPEQPLVLIAAKKLGRPVRWSAERIESFLADDHGRDMRLKGELALDASGKILAFRITGEANMGGYLSQYAPFVATLAGGRIFGGLYRIPQLTAAVKGYFSNSAPVDAYRGAGRPEAAYLIERLMDAAAIKMGLD